MKKIFLVISIISVLFLVGCNKKENEEYNSTDIILDDEIKKEDVTYINFNYTSLEDLKNLNLIPEEPVIGEVYDVGNLKLNDNIYKVKYVMENKEESEPEEGISKEGKLKFYLGDVEKLELLINTEAHWRDYIKEISMFNKKYLVTVTNNNAGDSLQCLEIYDDNLNQVKVSYSVDNEDKTYINEEGTMFLHNGYENYYSVNENNITYIRTQGNKKVTIRLIEVNDEIKATIIDETTEGVLPNAGREI